MCLICRQSLDTLKSYNLKRHHEQEHDVIAKLNDSARNTKLQLLKSNLQAQQNVFQKAASEDKAIVNASLRISQIITKKMKQFSDGEFVKDSLLAAVEELAPTKVKDFRKISLFHQTVTQRIDLISNTLKTASNSLTFFTLAFDETTNILDTSQLSIFVRGVNDEMKINEDFLDVIGLKEKTTCSNVKDAIVKCAEDHGLDLKNLIGIATDGAPLMVGRNAGAVTLILSHIDSLKEGSSATDEMFICHCFLHLENLCAQVLDMSHVMKVIVTTVNVIKHNALKHHQFQQYLIELESEYGDLLYYAKVHWLSRGWCLERFWNLKEEVGNFMTENGSPVPQLEDGKWLLNLCILVDITTKLNELNKKLQGKDKLITDCHEDVQAFITKFKLYEKQLASKNAYHFPLLNTFNCEDKDVTKYSAETEKLLRAFSERFEYLKKYEKSLCIFACPFDFVPEDAPEYLQLELIDLQVNTEQKSLFYTMENCSFIETMFRKVNFRI